MELNPPWLINGLPPVQPIDREVVPFQMFGERQGPVDWTAQGDQNRIGEEDKFAPRFEQTVGLRDPNIGVASQRRPIFADGEVEGLCGVGHLLGAAMNQSQTNPVFGRKPAGSG